MSTMKRTLKELKENESLISMLLGGLVVIVVGVLLVNYFRSSPQPQVSEEAEQTEGQEYVLEFEENETGERTPKGLPTTHTVEEGQNLWEVAETYYGSGYNWVDIAQENNMENPNIITAGQELAVPKASAKMATVEAQAETAQAETEAQIVSAEQAIEGDTYTVERGDNLWEIAVRAYQDGYQWTRIYEANSEALNSPDLLEIGMELTIPRG